MGEDKAMLDLEGEPMVLRVAGTLRRSGVAPVMIVGGGNRDLGLPHVPDRYPGEGPLGGIIAALQSSSSSAVLVVACDLPGLDSQTVQALLGAVRGHDVAVARTDRLESLCAVWQRSCLDRLEAAFDAGERSPRQVIANLDAVEVPVSAAALANVNTPADLAVFRRAGN